MKTTVLEIGARVEFIHATGKVKKGFTIGKSYEVLNIKPQDYLDHINMFCVRTDDGIRKWIATSTDQFKVIEKKKNHFKELNEMGFADLKALRSFIKEMIESEYDKTIWEYNLAIVELHIDKSVKQYFGIEFQ